LARLREVWGVPVANTVATWLGSKPATEAAA
jgi:hypothetical protein